MGVNREIELQTITTRYIKLKNLGLDEESIMKLLGINKEELDEVKGSLN